MAKNYMSENDYKNADYTNGKNASNKAQDKSQNKSQNKNSTNSSENCGKNASNADTKLHKCNTTSAHVLCLYSLTGLVYS